MNDTQKALAENEPISDPPCRDITAICNTLRTVGDLFFNKNEIEFIIQSLKNQECYFRTIALLKEETLAMEHFTSAEFHLREVQKKMKKLTERLDEQKGL